MNKEQLYAQAIKYLISRDYIVTPASPYNGIKAYNKDDTNCTLCVFYWMTSKGPSVSVWKTDRYPEECPDYKALLLIGCRPADNVLKSFIAGPKPTESYIPTWIRDLF